MHDSRFTVTGFNLRQNSCLRSALVLTNEYLAGLFDSEGSIAAVRTGNAGLTLIVLISNTYLPVLHEVRETLGYGYIITQKPRSPKHSTCYEWRTRNHNNVLDFISKVETHIRIKRDTVSKVAAAIREHKYNEESGSLVGVDQEFLVAFHQIMPLREIARMLGVHPKSVWRRLPTTLGSRDQLS
jgi:hypothetical protein